MNGRLQVCNERKQELQNELTTLDREIVEIKTSLAELDAKLAEADLPPTVNGVDRKRLPKGYALGVIRELLRSVTDGKGLTMSEIQKRTGINRSVIYKTIQRAEDIESDKAGKKWNLIYK
jgi:DNA invertase Pin-like site-specific DNA recombinase